jgi:hypothetical protein
MSTLYEYEIPKVTTTQNISKPFGQMYEQYGDFLGKGIRKWRPYPGEFLAGRSPWQERAQALRKFQLGQLSGIGRSTMQLGEDMAAGKYLNPDTNPWARMAARGAIRPVMDELFHGAMPRITSASIERGSYSGIRPQLTKVAAMGEAISRAGDITGKIYSDIYGRERTLQIEAPGLIQQGAALQDMKAAQMGKIGGIEQAWAQADIQNEMAKWREAHERRIEMGAAAAPGFQALPMPYTVRGPYGGMTMPGGSGGGSEAGGAGGALSGALGGAAMGASAGSALMAAGAVNAWNPVGWALMAGGAVLGGAAGYFGS